MPYSHKKSHCTNTPIWDEPFIGTKAVRLIKEADKDKRQEVIKPCLGLVTSC